MFITPIVLIGEVTFFINVIAITLIIPFFKFYFSPTLIVFIILFEYFIFYSNKINLNYIFYL